MVIITSSVCDVVLLPVVKQLSHRPAMKSVICFFLLSTLPYFGIGLHIKVHVSDDEGSELQHYEKELTDEDLEETPPFQTPDSHETFLLQNRRKRIKRMLNDYDDDEKSTVRTEPQCTQRMRQIRQRSKGQPVQLAYVVEPGEDVRLMCHYCGDANKWYQVMIWKRIVRKANKRGTFWIQDVKLDYHDDENMNRIYTTYDHSLVIRNISKDDIDTYFCHDRKRDKVTDEEISKEKMGHLFSATDRFRFYYHVDVVSSTQIPAKQVSDNDERYNKPAPPEEDGLLNLKYFTNWENWSPCSVCGKIGERRRRGVCTATLLDRDTVSDPPYIYYALRSFALGMPCRSSIFLAYKESMTKRPDEIKLEECQTKCNNLSFTGGREFSVNIEKISFKKVKEKVKEKHLNVTAGREIHLECPGATLDDMVYWVNGSKYMSSLEVSNSTRGRAAIDVYGRFHIYRAEFTDSAKYECWYRKRKYIVVFLTVLKAAERAEWITYLFYLLVSYTVDFWIFLAFMIMKHRHRQVQTTEAYYRQVPQVEQDTFQEETEQHIDFSKNEDIGENNMMSVYNDDHYVDTKENHTYDNY